VAVLCHLSLRWAHRFSRPNGVPYANTWNDRARNYLLGWHELGWDPGHALSFRKIVAGARFRGYRNVLLVEDDAIFHDSTIDVLPAIEADLEHRRWHLLYLGAVWSQRFPFAPRSAVLQIPRGITCTHCVAVNEPAFDRILADIPAEPGAKLEDGSLFTVVPTST
jgi:hypothetical protein